VTIKRLTFRHKYEIVVGTGGLASVIVAVFYDFNHPDVPIFLNREQCEKKVADRKETLYNQTEIRVALDRWPEAQIRPLFMVSTCGSGFALRATIHDPNKPDKK